MNKNLIYKAVSELSPLSRFIFKGEELSWLTSKNPTIEQIKTKVEELEKEEKEKHEKAQAKLQKEEELKTLTIDINTVLYDANQEALGNFATVISIANATFNKAISIGIDGIVMSLEDAYNYVYKEQTVNWKGADNKWHTVQIESIVQTAQDAMSKKAEILAKY